MKLVSTFSLVFLQIASVVADQIAVCSGEWPVCAYDASTDLQDGFIDGMAKEIQGIWVGDEKYHDENVGVDAYCSRAIINQQQYLTWETAYGTCKDNYVFPQHKSVYGKFFEKLLLPGYLERFRQYQCYPDDMCTEDITTMYDESDNENYSDYTLEAKACGSHLKHSVITEDSYTCNSFMVSLLSKEAFGRTEYLVVATLTYGSFPDWANQECLEPTFLNVNITANPLGSGSARFVLMQSYDWEGSLNPCMWDCFNGNDNYDCSDIGVETSSEP